MKLNSFLDRRRWLLPTAVSFMFSLQTQGAFGRSIFVNGIDISSARSQELKNVTVKINEQGDIFIDAPHYQVNEEDTYTPLSKFASGTGAIPVHQAPAELSADKAKVGATVPVPTLDAQAAAALQPAAAGNALPEAAATSPNAPKPVTPMSDATAPKEKAGSKAVDGG